VDLTAAGTVNGYTVVSTGTSAVTGSAAADILTGTGANDSTFNGGAGDDTITGGSGVDTIDVGTGADVVVVNAVVGTSSDSGRVTVTDNNNDTGQDAVTNFAVGTDVLRIVASNVASFVHGTDTAVGTATGDVNDGTVGSFLATTGLIELNQTTDNDWDDAGDIAVTFVGSTANKATFESGLQYNLTAATGGSTMTAGGLADTLIGGAGVDIITGGAGADNITAGGGLDVLAGGTGADIFVSTAVLATNAVNITDFTTTEDDFDFNGTLLNAAVSTVVATAGATLTAALTAGVNTVFVINLAANNGALTAAVAAYLADKSNANADAVEAAAVTAIGTDADLDTDISVLESVLIAVDNNHTDNTGESMVFRFANTTATGNVIDAGELTLIGILGTGDLVIGDFI
jgi:Ca2+-binding RTX toxin-like protein